MVCTKQEKELLIAFDQKLLEIQRDMTAEYMRIKELFKTCLDHDKDMIDIVCEVSFYMKDYEEEILSVKLQDFYFEDDDDLSGIELCYDGRPHGFDCSIILTKMHSASITIEEILSKEENGEVVDLDTIIKNVGNGLSEIIMDDKVFCRKRFIIRSLYL